MIYNLEQIQFNLGLANTGFLDEFTKAAIRNFQITAGLYPSGLLDDDTLTKMEKRFGVSLKIEPKYETNYVKEDNVVIPNITTDFMEVNSKIKDYKLKPGQFINSINKKTLIFIHHTAGWNNPYAVIDDWNLDSRGQIGTHYVIGGPSIKGDLKYDGEVVKCIDEKHHAYHLGGNIPSKLTTESISIELCNFGQLTSKNGKYFTYTGAECPKNQVIELPKSFRGFKFWHKYSAAQLLALKELLIDIGKRNNIDIKKGLPALLKTQDSWLALELNPNLCKGIDTAGVWSHTNVRSDKVDVAPQPEIIQMLKNL